MFIFNSYVKLPEGIFHLFSYWGHEARTAGHRRTLALALGGALGATPA